MSTARYYLHEVNIQKFTMVKQETKIGFSLVWFFCVLGWIYEIKLTGFFGYVSGRLICEEFVILVCCDTCQVNKFMVTKPPRPSALNSSLANTSKSSCDSVSSTASAAPRLTATHTRPSATSTPDCSGAKLARTKSLNPVTKPAPVPRRTGTARQSIASGAQSTNINPTMAEAKPVTKSVTQATLKRRLSVAAASKSVLDQKMPLASSTASKPPPGQSRSTARPASSVVSAAAAAAADNKLARKK